MGAFNPTPPWGAGQASGQPGANGQYGHNYSGSPNAGDSFLKGLAMSHPKAQPAQPAQLPAGPNPQLPTPVLKRPAPGSPGSNSPAEGPLMQPSGNGGEF